MAQDTIKKPTNARSRRTRASLLAAARTILDEKGFEALTTTAVADRAGVTRRAVYLHFASRSELIGALFDHVAATEGLEQSMRKVRQAPDALNALDEWAAHLAHYHPRVLAVDRAMQRVWHTDADAAAHRNRVVAEKLSNCQELATRLAEEGHLASGWSITSASDMLYALISSDMIEALLIDRRWSKERLAAHLALLFRSTFTT